MTNLKPNHQRVKIKLLLYCRTLQLGALYNRPYTTRRAHNSARWYSIMCFIVKHATMILHIRVATHKECRPMYSARWYSIMCFIVKHATMILHIRVATHKECHPMYSIQWQTITKINTIPQYWLSACNHIAEFNK